MRGRRDVEPGGRTYRSLVVRGRRLAGPWPLVVAACLLNRALDQRPMQQPVIYRYAE